MFKNTIGFTPATFREVGMRANRLEVGEMAYTTEGWFSDGRHYLLRTPEGVADLTDSSNFWLTRDSVDWAFPTVIKLRAGDVVTITQGLTTTFVEEVKTIRILSKIEAIKRVREVTGWGLKESKTYVDNL